MSGEGHDGIDAMIAGVQAQFPGFASAHERVGRPQRSRSVLVGTRARGWPPLAGGVDFGVIADDRLQTITGFLDFAPGAAGA